MHDMTTNIRTTMHHRRALIISGLLAVAMGSAMLTPAAVAQQLDPKILRQRPEAAKSQPVARPRPRAACSEYGAGYVRIESTGTCVRAGGAIDVGVGMSR